MLNLRQDLNGCTLNIQTTDHKQSTLTSFRFSYQIALQNQQENIWIRSRRNIKLLYNIKISSCYHFCIDTIRMYYWTELDYYIIRLKLRYLVHWNFKSDIYCFIIFLFSLHKGTKSENLKSPSSSSCRGVS